MYIPNKIKVVWRDGAAQEFTSADSGHEGESLAEAWKVEFTIIPNKPISATAYFIRERDASRDDYFQVSYTADKVILDIQHNT